MSGRSMIKKGCRGWEGANVIIGVRQSTYRRTESLGEVSQESRESVCQILALATATGECKKLPQSTLALQAFQKCDGHPASSSSSPPEACRIELLHLFDQFRYPGLAVGNLSPVPRRTGSLRTVGPSLPAGLVVRRPVKQDTRGKCHNSSAML